MDDLITWLRAQLDEDERVARRAGWDHPVWVYDKETFTVSSEAWPIAAKKGRGGSPINDVDGEHIARWDPARVLAEIDAKRRIIVRCEEEMLSGIPRLVHFCRQTAWEMARPYADRKGFRDTWRP